MANINVVGINLTTGNTQPVGPGDAVTNSSGSSVSGLPSGSMVSYGGTTLPSGWLECDGAAVSRTTFSGLFTAVGISWGAGDGSTTFNLPSLARRTLVGRGGTGTGTLGNAVGNVGGAETHTLITSELASHTHGVTDPGHSHLAYYGGGSGSGAQSGYDTSLPLATSSNTTGITVNAAGGNAAHNNMQPSAVVMMIIKT